MEFDELIKEQVFDYDTSTYDFRSLIAKALKCEDRDMSLLHTTIPDGDKQQLLTFAHDQCLVFHRVSAAWAGLVEVAAEPQFAAAAVGYVRPQTWSSGSRRFRRHGCPCPQKHDTSTRLDPQ